VYKFTGTAALVVMSVTPRAALLATIIPSRIDVGGGEMFFLRLTLYTCAFYACMALPIIIAELVITYRSGFSVFFYGRSGIAAFAGFWGLVWLASFVLAFRKVFPFIWTKLVIGA
jgi:hypothetical protein